MDAEPKTKAEYEAAWREAEARLAAEIEARRAKKREAMRRYRAKLKDATQ